jgi:FAD/FMN-containing dehydrogenase
VPLSPRIEWTGPVDWVNRHENVRRRVARLIDLRNARSVGGRSTVEAYNAMTAAVQDLLRQAVDSGVRVRAAGGGWSLSECAVTDGWLLNTQPLDLTFRLGPAVLTDEYQDKVSRLLFSQCGMGIAQLGSLLRRDKQSLATSGASNGQTLVGAISTGTHGAAIDVGAVQDSVRGLHLIPGPDQSIWLEPARRPVATEEFADVLGAELVRDDALFDAALVSFGCFGFIHGVLIETSPLFLLEAYRKTVPQSAPLRRAVSHLDFDVPELPHPGQRPYHFQLVVNPHDAEAAAHVTIMYRRAFRADYEPPHRDPAGIGVGDDAPSFVGHLTDTLPQTIPGIANLIMRQSYKDKDRTEGTLSEIFSNTTTRGQVSSTAMGIPLAQAERALDAILDEHRDKGPAAVLVSLRYVKGSQATLAFTRFPATCVLEIDGVQSNRTHDFYEAAWARLAREGIPYTFHWGKQHNLSATLLRRMYGEGVNGWLAARRRLLDREARALFASDFAAGLGLAD